MSTERTDSADRVEGLRTEGDLMVGTATVTVPSWAKSAARSDALDRLLAGPLHDFATGVGRTLVAAAHRYAFARGGADAKRPDGALVYDIRGRFEGEAIVPARTPAPPRPRTPPQE